jgi:hypothetical protein
MNNHDFTWEDYLKHSEKDKLITQIEEYALEIDLLNAKLKKSEFDRKIYENMYRTSLMNNIELQKKIWKESKEEYEFVQVEDKECKHINLQGINL